MKNLLFGFTLFTAIGTIAQNGWNWPTDEAQFKLAQEKQAYYKVLMGQDKYLEALDELQWLYDNNANLNPSIYIDGSKCAEKVIETTEDKARVIEFQDKSLWMYDQRIKHFGDEAGVMDRKAYAAFKYFYKTKSKYPVIFELYEKAYELNGANISDFNLLPYMTAAKYGYDWKLPEATRENVLEIHSLLSDVMDKKEAAGEDMTDYRNKIDAMFRSMEGVLSCDFIENSLVPRFRKSPNDIGMAKKIVAYSIDAKCSDKEYFLQAGEVVVTKEPSFKFLKIIADKRFNRKEYVKASELYAQAEKLASNDQDRYDVLMGQAKSASQLGQKSKARGYARLASTTKLDEKDPFEFIGNLYMSSYEECAEKESRVDDRLVFIAAYDQYKKAGNQKLMEIALAQFPSMEEIFDRNLELGIEMTVGCWINEKVVLKKR